MDRGKLVEEMLESVFCIYRLQYKKLTLIELNEGIQAIDKFRNLIKQSGVNNEVMKKESEAMEKLKATWIAMKEKVLSETSICNN